MNESERLDAARRLEEQKNHGGEVVARHQKGNTDIYATNYEELYKILNQQQKELRDYVIAYIPHPNEVPL